MQVKLFFLLVSCGIYFSPVCAQGKYFTKNGTIKFFSTTPLEDIEAINKGVTAALDAGTGDIQFSVLMKGFQFKKALMQEHFNENYVESHKFPQSEFKGKILNAAEINFSKNGTYPAKVKGLLTIHGVTKDLETAGTITIKDGKLQAGAVFPIRLSDYKINIARIHRNNIAKTIKITVDCILEPVVK